MGVPDFTHPIRRGPRAVWAIRLGREHSGRLPTKPTKHTKPRAARMATAWLKSTHVWVNEKPADFAPRAEQKTVAEKTMSGKSIGKVGTAAESRPFNLPSFP